MEAFTLASVDTVQSLGISFDPGLSFKNQIATVVKNFNFQICNIYALRKWNICKSYAYHTLLLLATHGTHTHNKPFEWQKPHS